MKTTYPYKLTKKQINYMKLKSLMDFIVAGLGLIVLFPLFLIIVIAIKVEEGWDAPVFFKQKRVGFHKEYFNLYKFRSMRLDAPHDLPTHLFKNPEEYITKTGRILRRFSLDELPQLLNVLKGELSLCGPRPALWNQYDLNEERERYGVHQIKPGLTGWAQIHGRDELETKEKAYLDSYYLCHLGPMIDLRCFFGTFKIVLTGEGIVEGQDN